MERLLAGSAQLYVSMDAPGTELRSVEQVEQRGGHFGFSQSRRDYHALIGDTVKGVRQIGMEDDRFRDQNAYQHRQQNRIGVGAHGKIGLERQGSQNERGNSDQNDHTGAPSKRGRVMRASAPEEFFARQQMRRDDGSRLRVHRSLDDVGGAQRGDLIVRVAEVLAENLVGVRAQQRGGAIERAGSHGKLGQQAGLHHAAPLRMRQLGDQAVLNDLRIVEQFTNLIHTRSRDRGGL